jgi:hypothetical protein
MVSVVMMTSHEGGFARRCRYASPILSTPKNGPAGVPKPQQFAAQSLSSDWMGTKSKPLAAGER